MSEPKKESFKDKMLDALTGVYTGAENALRGLVSKRMYVIAALVYLAISEMESQKFIALCAVACVYIWSETKSKPKG